MRLRNLIGVLAIVVVGWAGSASGEYFSFTYSELDGDFVAVPGSYLFTAVSDIDTDGEVTRVDQDAFFEGEAAGYEFFSLEMNLTTITPISAEVLPGDGVLTLTDVNGDVITFGAYGLWLNIGGSANFVGLLTDGMIADNSADGTFDGTSGPGFSTVFPTNPPYEGNIHTLSFGGWFTDKLGMPTDFSDITTLTSGAVIPEPATLSLLALSGLAMLRRRR